MLRRKATADGDFSGWITASELFAMSIIPRRSTVESRVAYLCWQNQAGGYSFSHEDVLAMTLDEMDRYIAIADQRRREYNEAVKAANKPKPKR